MPGSFFSQTGTKAFRLSVCFQMTDVGRHKVTSEMAEEGHNVPYFTPLNKTAVLQEYRVGTTAFS